MNGLKQVVIVSTVLPRWIADFGAVTDWFTDNKIAVTLYVPRPEASAKTGWRSRKTIDAARHELPDSVEFRYLPGDSTHRVNPISLLQTILESYKISRAHPDALIFLWNPLPIVLFGPILRLRGNPVIYMVTGLGWTFSPDARGSVRRRIIHTVYRFLFRGINYRILVHNREDREVLAQTFRIQPQQIYVTPGCGVVPSEFPFEKNQPDTTRPVILVPVRLLIQKGVLDAAEASRILVERGCEHEMWFTSNLDPTHPSALTQDDLDRITANNPAVRFMGFQESLLPFYRNATVVCVPTYYQEGLPTALLEAAAVGRPIVTCDNYGGRDFIRHEVDGFLVPPKSPQAIADSLEKLLTDPATAERLRLSAHQRFLQGFTKQKMLDITLQACRDLLDGNVGNVHETESGQS